MSKKCKIHCFSWKLSILDTRNHRSQQGTLTVLTFRKTVVSEVSRKVTKMDPLKTALFWKYPYLILLWNPEIAIFDVFARFWLFLDSFRTRLWTSGGFTLFWLKSLSKPRGWREKCKTMKITEKQRKSPKTVKMSPRNLRSQKVFKNSENHVFLCFFSQKVSENA